MTLNYTDMMENTLAFSVSQSATNAGNQKHSKRWILNKLSVYVMLNTWKTVNLLNHKLGNNTAQSQDVCLLEVYATQYYKTGYIYMAQKSVISQSAIIM